MSHSLSLFVARRPQLEALSVKLGGARIYRLQYTEFLILPVTDDGFDAIVDSQGPSEPAAEEFWRLTKALCALAQACSQFGPIAYVETDYFGGSGTQGAAAWELGNEIMAPTVSWSTGPINTALNAIGLAPSKDLDEFETLGLHTVRRMDAFEEMEPA